MMYANYWGNLPGYMHGTLSGGIFGLLMLPIVIWSLFWKGWALWVAAHKESKGWFAALLVINTAGILEIIYIFLIANRSSSNTKKSSSKIGSKNKK